MMFHTLLICYWSSYLTSLTIGFRFTVTISYLLRRLTTKSIASPIVFLLLASMKGISTPNSFSNSAINSTIFTDLACRSSAKRVSLVSSLTSFLKILATSFVTRSAILSSMVVVFFSFDIYFNYYPQAGPQLLERRKGEGYGVQSNH